MLCLGLLALGCGRARPVITDRVTIFVPGVMGDGSWYNGTIQSLQQNGREPVEVLTWGAPKGLFMANFSTKSIHDAAEIKLAKRLDELAGKRVDLVGHSAGCGVILGAIPRSRAHVSKVILLAPSVSPAYDLQPALAQVDRKLVAFYSDLDVTFLKWRTGNFGTYDRIKTPAAGHSGFDVSRYGSQELAKIAQVPYDPNWKPLGHDGGHDGCVAGKFVSEIVVPQLQRPSPGSSSPRD